MNSGSRNTGRRIQARMACALSDPVSHAQPGARSPRRRDGMNRLSPLRNPLLLGFDEFERTLERITKALSLIHI